MPSSPSPAHRPQEEQQGRNAQRRGDDRKGAGRGVAHVPPPAADLEGGGWLVLGKRHDPKDGDEDSPPKCLGECRCCEKWNYNELYGSYMVHIMIWFKDVQSFVDGKCLLTPAKYGDL